MIFKISSRTRCKDRQEFSIMKEKQQEKSPIKQNILLYLGKKGVTPYEFYKKSGVTRGILQQNNGISEDNITRFLAYAPDVNPSWLLTGVGPMLLDVAPPAQVSSVNSAVAMHGNAINTVTTESSNSASRDSQELQLAKQKIEALEKLLDEKERLIKVLLDKK